MGAFSHGLLVTKTSRSEGAHGCWGPLQTLLQQSTGATHCRWGLQAQALFLERGVPGRGPRREALQAALSVAMNLTHNNAAGCAAVLGAGGLAAAAQLLDAVLGPPEEDAAFVAIADRCIPFYDSPMTSVCHGLLPCHALTVSYLGERISWVFCLVQM